MSMPIDVAKQQAIAADLVVRARQFDQNAIGMIDAIAQSAKAGSKVAQSALGFIKMYIARNPVRGAPVAPVVSGDPELVDVILGVLKAPNALEDKLFCLAKLPTVATNEDVCAACVILCLCPPIPQGRVAEAAKAVFRGPYMRAFQYGYETPKVRKGSVPSKLVPAAFAGHTVGMAQRIQLVKTRRANPGILNDDIQDELVG